MKPGTNPNRSSIHWRIDGAPGVPRFVSRPSIEFYSGLAARRLPQMEKLWDCHPSFFCACLWLPGNGQFGSRTRSTKDRYGTQKTPVKTSARIYLLPTISLGLVTFSINVSTIEGSANVDVSPKLSVSPDTILRKMRRIIFPLRVIGKDGEMTMTSGAQKAPTSLRTATLSSVMSSGLSSKPFFSIQNAQIACPLRS